tara:strand:+ start:663 stop:1991 length:1329 start_codon:yes stop_codon:yes gene_type:complete
MVKPILIKEKIKPFNKKIFVNGDKSLSIRWALMASQAIGKSRAYNILKSEDVKSALKCLNTLGIKSVFKKDYCEINGDGINSFKFKKNLVLNAGNSGTVGRLLLALLIRSPYKIKLIGDKSLSKRDFSRVITPLKYFGAKFYPNNKTTLPIYIQGTDSLKPIDYYEKKGSAQVKSCVMLAALNISGETKIIAKKSRDHTEILFKHLKIPLKVKKTKNLDYIKVKGLKNFKSFNYNIPSDISSSSFFIVLTTLAQKSSLVIKNVNINPSRIGVISILKMMNAKIKLKKIKNYKGEKIADIYVKSSNSLKSINCPIKFNSSAIDEFLIIFLVAAKAKGVSYFKNLSELDQKESPRLKLGSKILNMMGIKTILTKHSIKIFGNPNLQIKKNIEIKDYLLDHRVFMMSTIAALSFGNIWKINNPESINTSFPSFLKIIKKIGGKIK